IIHNYGVGRCIASIHAEIPSNIDIMEIHEIIDTAEREISEKLVKEARAVETISKLKHLLDKQKDILLGDKNLNSFAEYDTLFHTT
ncbi:hypothetical protein ACTPEF_24600, partial [Clostridioides difficile]